MPAIAAGPLGLGATVATRISADLTHLWRFG